MVSGTQCPPRSDPVKKWSESRAAAPKAQYPVEHRGEFSDVLISGLESRTKAWGEDLGFGEQIEYRQDPNKSGGGTLSVTCPPYSSHGSINFHNCSGG